MNEELKKKILELARLTDEQQQIVDQICELSNRLDSLGAKLLFDTDDDEFKAVNLRAFEYHEYEDSGNIDESGIELEYWYAPRLRVNFARMFCDDRIVVKLKPEDEHRLFNKNLF